MPASPTPSSPTNTSPLPTLSKPTPRHPRQPLTIGKLRRGTVGFSATATAPDPSNLTADSRPSAKAAASTKPAPSSSPSCAANATTPSPTPTWLAQRSTTSSFESSTTALSAARPLHNQPSPWFHEHSPGPEDHPCNGTSGTRRWRLQGRVLGRTFGNAGPRIGTF